MVAHLESYKYWTLSLAPCRLLLFHFRYENLYGFFSAGFNLSLCGWPSFEFAKRFLLSWHVVLSVMFLPTCVKPLFSHHHSLFLVPFTFFCVLHFQMQNYVHRFDHFPDWIVDCHLVLGFFLLGIFRFNICCLVVWLWFCFVYRCPNWWRSVSNLGCLWNAQVRYIPTTTKKYIKNRKNWFHFCGIRHACFLPSLSSLYGHFFLGRIVQYQKQIMVSVSPCVVNCTYYIVLCVCLFFPLLSDTESSKHTKEFCTITKRTRVCVLRTTTP